MTQPRYTERHPASSSSSSQQSQWTVGLILDATLEVDGLTGKMGTPQRESALMKLQAESVGKPVNIVVQAVKPNPQYKEGDSEANKMLLHRFVIHDGKLDELAAPKSDGLANNVTNFVKFIGQSYPAKHQALSLLLHGGSVEGARGDDGYTSLSALQKAISDGIGSSRKFDVLDFDACLMASRPVVDNMSRVASHMIASEELEQAWPKSTMNLQDANAWIRRLYTNPSLSPKGFADAAVDIAAANQRSQDLSSGETSETVFFTNLATLAHYDLEKYPQFAKSFDVAANALSVSALDPKNKAVYSSLFDETPALGHVGEPKFIPPSMQWLTRRELRDLHSFSENTRRMIDSGQIKDPSHAVEQSLKSLKRSEVALISKKFATNHGMHEFHNGVRVHYSDLGGMSAFLPGNDFDNAQEDVADKTMLGAFIGLSRAVIDAQHSKTPSDATKLNLSHLAEITGDIIEQAGNDEQAKTIAKQLASETSEVKSAAFERDAFTKEKLTEVYETAKRLQNIGIFRDELKAAEAPSEAHYQQERKEDQAAGGEAWDKFIDTVRAH
ncbi:MAG: clostripain-related cysteine peptidase [Candidatus Obscuribacterales bacterium]|nr:clostripain-related cysteine peptidase [Candidatus Obscuribacterales bacterium]